MAKTATATRRIERGMSRGGSLASSDRLETVSMPVYAIIATGIARKKSFHVGATPQWTFAFRIDGLKMRTKPITTRSSWVAKSTTARKMFSPAASLIPTMFSPTRRAITAAPTTTSHGLSLSGSQKIER